MVDRVLLDAQGLRVSMPGVNVRTATDAQVTFDSAYSMIVPVLKGNFLSEPRPGTGQPPEPITVNFGRTFSKVPLCCFYVDLEKNTEVRGNQHIGSHRRSFNINGTLWSYYGRVLNDRLVFTNNIVGPESWELRVRYFIWNFDL
ncbi:hypothetical protein [Chelativorans sp. YIM 93263]|uniref:hypothetical protein n=1 Tax=Chelativorans sp. YIM 93263 TaxID=2906648 RepID=UPI002379E10E|nr:hypothetical protein [Chelativorans sp. YIM 93263]